MPNPDAADVDGDGKITSTDARLLLQVSVGKISERQLPVNLEPGAVFAGDFRAISGTVSNAEHGVQFKGSGSYDFGSGAVYNKTVKADGLRIFLGEMNLGTTACQNKGQGGLLICLTRDGTQATDGLRIQLDFNVYSNTVLNVTNQAGETLAQSNDGLFWRNINGGVPTRDLTVTLKKDGDKYLLSFLTASRSYPSIYPQTDGISVTYELDAGKVEAAFGGEEIGLGLFPYFQNPTAVVAESTLVIGSIGNITEG